MREGLKDRLTNLRPADLVNISNRQVLRRSLYTVLTVLTGAVSLFLFGAEPLQMFSLAIFLGLLWATFASLFIAPFIWLTMTPAAEKGPQPELG